MEMVKKGIISTLLALVVLITGVSCSSGNYGFLSKNGYSSYESLTDALKSISGLKVSQKDTFAGVGDNVSVQIKGENSSVSQIQPLFVVNGNLIGRNFSEANAIVSIKEVRSIRVIKGEQATKQWGEAGDHGVIVIRTRSRDSCFLLNEIPDKMVHIKDYGQFFRHDGLMIT